MQEIINKFTTHLKNVLTRALTFVVENQLPEVLPEHMLWALATQKGSIGAELLAKAGVKVEDVRRQIAQDTVAALDPRTNVPLLAETARRMVEKAVLTANVYDHRYVGTEHLLSGMLQADEGSIGTFFLEKGIDVARLKQQVDTVLKSTSRFPDLTDRVNTDQQTTGTTPTNTSTASRKEEKADDKKTPALDYFAYELTSAEAQKSIDPVIGREREIERVLQILCRRTKNNPILLGEPGVGKTAIVEGLAKKILSGEVPPEMRGKRLFALDLSLLIAGTMYRGEFEGRLKQIIEETTKHEEIILFIDEVHMIVGAGSASGSLDAANMLKPALARGDIRCIGATTPAEYKKQFESDAALERRFCPVPVAEPNVEKTLTILRGVRATYEAYHHVTIDDAALEAAVQLSARYLQDKHQPDKSLDLIDEACAALRLLRTADAPISAAQQRTKRLTQVREEKRQAIVEERFADALRLKEEEIALTAPSLLPNEEPAQQRIGTITDVEITEVVARATGIPLNELLSETRRMKQLESALHARVIGQTEAVKTAAQAIRRAKAGVRDPRRPLASFLFLGPTGVGKTELARAIAEVVFQDEAALITLDMSEFAEGFSVSKLVGAPAGYVGYREPTKLTDKVKQKPYAVVLFDEIEKAHKDVHGLLLQILENGTLADATGKTINFKNTIVVMTSNAGAERFAQGEMGFTGSADRGLLTMTADLRRELEESFRPELLNRIDHVCLFQPLQTDSLTAIAEKMLTELTRRLQSQTIQLTIAKEVAAHLAQAANQRHGARDLRRLIETQVESLIADALLGQTKKPKLNIVLNKEKLAIKKG